MEIWGEPPGESLYLLLIAYLHLTFKWVKLLYHQSYCKGVINEYNNNTYERCGTYRHNCNIVWKLKL